MSDQPDLFEPLTPVPLSDAIEMIREQRKLRGEPIPVDPDFDPFEDEESVKAREEAMARLEARKAGIETQMQAPKGFKAFNPVVRPAHEMVQDWADHGDAEKTGGKPKKKNVDDRPLVIAFLKSLYPEAIEIRNEERYETIMGGPYKGMVVKKDRDGFIDFSVQFLGGSEIAIQATTVGGESDHMKKMSTRNRKAGDNVHRWLKGGRKLFMVLADSAPGKKGVRYDWQKVGRFQRVVCIYEITLEMLQASRERRAKLAESKARRLKEKK